ncbi:cell division GTPase FtsZ [Methanocalculus alkaliphilus]|uniref:tubulin/FtsZ family protein n=1 Tax=Methanocalculus alkaliphilus TaxID=768730 RepID=UPI00209E80E4|nr:tubulin/FtsZ family protein [Methanocalculus alkaliphilus]MCP1714238.1 cell division GTPase FtsZ [Methanocalculus alkaliphilus]
MKALIIGLGGAGSRIADVLADHDRRSGTHSIEAIAIDTDYESINNLRTIPHTQRIVLPSLHVSSSGKESEILDIAEVIGHIQRCNTIEIDAIVICTGLGGKLAHSVPLIVEKIRGSFFEPVFVILTLPFRSEGKMVAARAADQIEMIEGVVDGCILFDNETWYKKIATEMLRLERTTDDQHSGDAEEEIPEERIDGFTLNPRDRNNILNERLARRFGLLLRAGEFVENGKPVAEVVLDAGEVLNTLKGMGMAAIGYATELVPRDNFGFLRRFTKGYNVYEDGHKRAARIVELSKRAIYQEISVPCDLTSANKALVLIAGPSDEISMKGFQNVRKWVDRSIAGLEMRAGDYPVLSTKYVGVIIVLAGIKNIPRINEIKEMRDIYIEEEREERERQEGLSKEKAELERKARERAERAALLHHAEEDEEELPVQEWIPEPARETPLPSQPLADVQQYPMPDDDANWISAPERNDQEIPDEIQVPQRGGGDDRRKLTLPRRQAGEVADISRQERIEGPISPNDRTMDAGSFRMKGHPVEKGRTDTASISLSPMVQARDGSFEAKAVALKTHFSRPRDAAIDEKDMFSIKSQTSQPRDDVLMGKGSSASRVRRPDDSAYFGKSGSIQVKGESESRHEEREVKKKQASPVRDEEEGDGGITWI